MTTYLEMVNLGLEEINETPMTSGQFTLARGVQRYAKGAVNKAYKDISNESIEWPWLASAVARVEGTEVLEVVPGTQWYDIASPDIEVDWHTFYMTDKDPSVSSEIEPDVSKTLIYLTYEQWSRTSRAYDSQRTTITRGVPDYVIRHPNGKIGFSKVPDKAYFMEYLTWVSSVSFSSATDVIPFPEEFNNTLQHRVAYYLWKFRENQEQASASNNDYDKTLASMKRILLSNKSERMRAV